MKFIETFWNKDAYKREVKEGKTKGIVNVLIASIISIALSFCFFLINFYQTTGSLNFLSLYDDFTSQIVKGYPSDLNINIKDGILTTNKKELTKIGEIPKSESENIYQYEDIDSYITIDENKEVGLKELEESKSLFFVGKDGLIAYKNNGQTQGLNFNKVGNLDININVIDEIIGEVRGYVLPFVAIIGFIIFILGMLGIFVFNIIWNLLLSLIIKSTSLIKKGLDFDIVYKIINNVSVPAIIIGSIVTSFGVSFPFLETIIVVLSLYLIYKNKENKESSN